MHKHSLPGSAASVVSIALAAVILVACSKSPHPSPPAPQSTSAIGERYGAPLIAAPRDLRSRANAPCSELLTPGQLASLGYGPDGVFRRVLDQAPSCSWRGTGPDRTIDATVWTVRDYFIDTYRTRIFSTFRPTVIAGLPAVEQQSPSGKTLCTTTVGAAESQTLDVTSSVDDVGPGGQPVIDPCSEGRRVIEAIIFGLPPL